MEDRSMDGMVLNILKDNYKTEIVIKSDIKLKSFWGQILMLSIYILLFILGLFKVVTFDIIDTIVAMFFLLLNLFYFTLFTGKEIILISPKNLTITQKILFFKRSSSYEKNKIKDLRSIDKEYPATKKGKTKKLWHMILLKNGVITFNHMNKEVSFGSLLEVDQGRYVIENYLKNLEKETSC